MIKLWLSSILLGASISMAYADEPRAPSAADIIAKKEQVYIDKLAILKKRNPKEDAKAATALGFPYVLGYHRGRSRVIDIPGVDMKQYEAKKSNCPTLIMDGMGDMIYGVKHQEYRKALREYAIRFNQYTFAACK